MDIRAVVFWIVLGLVAGALAKFIMPGKDPGGCLVTIILGIAGAFVGGWLGTQFGFNVQVGGLDLASFVTATVGALVILLVYRLVIGGKK